MKRLLCISLLLFVSILTLAASISNVSAAEIVIDTGHHHLVTI